jgi:hypothetical protein
MSVEGNEFKKEISKIIHKRRPVKLL